MTHHAASPHNRPSTSRAWLAALDLTDDDIVRPTLRNGAVPAGKREPRATSAATFRRGSRPL